MDRAPEFVVFFSKVSQNYKMPHHLLYQQKSRSSTKKAFFNCSSKTMMNCVMSARPAQGVARTFLLLQTPVVFMTC